MTPDQPTLARSKSSVEARDHPAARAWRELRPRSPIPRHIEVLKRPRPNGKSAVFGLGAVGPDGAEVVAKELLAGAAEIELTLYRNVLPRLSVGGPAWYGSIRSGDQRTWLFLEAVTGPRFDKHDPRHRTEASHWLATLHGETARRTIEARLPARGPGHYRTLVEMASAALADVIHNPAMSAADRQVLRRTAAHMEAVTERWELVAEIYGEAPEALMHGDFKRTNMAFAPVESGSALKVFDWSEAHWGPLVVDLWAAEPVEYRRVLHTAGLTVGVAALDRWRRLGTLLRLVSSIVWEIPRLRFQWLERPMRHMALYEERLPPAIEGVRRH